MGTKDRASNLFQEAKGRVEEAIGSIVGKHDLKDKGETDQAEAGAKNVGEDLKDAVQDVKGTVTR
jgi:uncharacterized protein YjbJ (UPF0337 family)